VTKARTNKSLFLDIKHLKIQFARLCALAH